MTSQEYDFAAAVSEKKAESYDWEILFVKIMQKKLVGGCKKPVLLNWFIWGTLKNFRHISPVLSIPPPPPKKNHIFNADC